VATTSPAGNTLTEEQRYKIQSKLWQERLRRTQNQVRSLTAEAERLKGRKDKRSQQTLARVQASLKSAQASLGDINKNITSLNNKHYEATGQYDKLLSGANRDAFMALQSLFKTYGLESLAGKIYEYVKNGYGSDTISILLQDTPEYKQRFAANQQRLKDGLPVLSPAEYIDTENSYRALLRQSGLPGGFYDSNDDFTNWIAKGVSPTEAQSRVDLATQATALANPFYKQALNQLGIDDGHLAAYFLDPDRALPLIQKAAATAQIGSAALAQGLTFDKTFAEQLATSGVTAAQAQQGYQQVAGELGTMQSLASVYGTTWTQAQSEQAAFGTNAAAGAQKASIVGQEKGAFSGGAGGGRAGLSQSQPQQ
jgi:hypothetical protein